MSDQLNLAHVTRKKLKETNASANLVQYRFKIHGFSRRCAWKTILHIFVP